MKATRSNAGFHFAFSAAPPEICRFPDESTRQGWIDESPASRFPSTATAQAYAIAQAKRHHAVDEPDSPLWIPSPNGERETLYVRPEARGPGRKPAENWKGLTDRELFLVRLIVYGTPHASLIAARTGTDEKTIRVHVRNIRRKLGVKKDQRRYECGITWAWEGFEKTGYPPGPGAGLTQDEKRMEAAKVADEARELQRANYLRDGKTPMPPGTFVADLLASRAEDEDRKLASEKRRLERIAEDEDRRAKREAIARDPALEFG